MDYQPNDGIPPEPSAEPSPPDETIENPMQTAEIPPVSDTQSQVSEVLPVSDAYTQTPEVPPVPLPVDDNTSAQPQPQDYAYPNSQPQGYAYTQPQPQGYAYTQPQPQGYAYTQPQPQGYAYTQPQPQGYAYPSTQPQGYAYPSTQPQGYAYPNAQPQGYAYPNAQPQGYAYPNAQPQGYAYPNYRPQQMGYYPYQPYPIMPYQPNSKGKCFGRAMIAIAVFIGAQIVLGIFMGVSIVFSQFGSYGYGADYDELGPTIALTLILSSIISIAALFPLYRRETKKRQFRPKSYPPNYPSVTIEPFALTTKGKLGPMILFPIAGIVAVSANILITGILTIIQNYYPPESSPVDDVLNSIPEDSVWMVLTLLTIGVIAPIAEELCLRGLFFNHLRRGFTFWSANLIQAGIFGIIHGNPTQATYAFVLGLFFGWVYEKTKRLSLPILLHIAFNSTSVLLGYVPGFYPLLTQNNSALIAVILPSFVITTVGVVCLAAILRQPKTTEALSE